jgi:hypothetical protein
VPPQVAEQVRGASLERRWRKRWLVDGWQRQGWAAEASGIERSVSDELHAGERSGRKQRGGRQAQGAVVE